MQTASAGGPDGALHTGGWTHTSEGLEMGLSLFPAAEERGSDGWIVVLIRGPLRLLTVPTGGIDRSTLGFSQAPQRRQGGDA